MTKEWNVKVAELEEKGDIVIKSVTEWHLLDGSLNAQRTVALWNMLAEQTIARGKSGVRVVGDTVGFFERGFGPQLLSYETTLEQRFNFPITAICAYEAKDAEGYSKEEFEELCKHHVSVWLPQRIDSRKW